MLSEAERDRGAVSVARRRAETHILASGRCALEGIVRAGPLERLRALAEAFAREPGPMPG